MSFFKLWLKLWYFSEGIEQVLPLKKLCTFFPDELQSILCGDQAPNWTRDDLLAFTEPKLGYTNERSVGALTI